MTHVDKLLTIDNIRPILNEFAKQYKKSCGSAPAEIIIVGGGSVMINYGFRPMTQDLDVVLKTSTGVKEAIYRTAEKFGLPNDWMNTDFKFLSSYSPKLEEISKHYRTLNNGALEIRTVNAEYLIAMKMQSGREFGNDISDIVGILRGEQLKQNYITFEKILNAGHYLYPNTFSISDRLRERVQHYCTLSIEELEQEYQKSIQISQDIKVQMTKQDNTESLNKVSAKQLAQMIESQIQNPSLESNAEDYTLE